MEHPPSKDSILHMTVDFRLLLHVEYGFDITSMASKHPNAYMLPTRAAAAVDTPKQFTKYDGTNKRNDAMIISEDLDTKCIQYRGVVASCLNIRKES